MILLKFNNRVATGFRTFPNPHAPRIHIKKKREKNLGREEVILKEQSWTH